MKRTMVILSLAAILAPATAEEPRAPQTKPAPLDANPSTNTPRTRALEVAAANRNQGHALRDGFWRGVLEKNKPVTIAVHLFAKNNYSFHAAHLAPGTMIRLAIFDPQGNSMGGEELAGENSATAGVSPTRSGRYYVRLELTKGDKADTCMVYSYK